MSAPEPRLRLGCGRRRGSRCAQPWGSEAARPVANSPDIDAKWLGRFPLSTKGRHVIDRQGERFKLAGVNWYGASDAYHVVGGLDVQKLEVICETIRDLGFSVIRLPFSNEMLRSRPAPGSIDFDLNPGLAGKTCLEVLDEVVRALGRCQVAVILNNHTTFGRWCAGPDDNGLWFLPERVAPWGPQTQEQWIEDWAMLAARYADCPQVVGYDLRNEVRAAPTLRGLGGLMPWLRWPVWQPRQQDEKKPSAEECPEDSIFTVHANWCDAAVAAATRLQQVNRNGLIIVERIVWPQRGLQDYAACPGPLLPRFQDKVVLAVHSYSWTAPGLFVVRWGVPPKLRPVMQLLAYLGLINWRSHGDMARDGGSELRKRMHREWGYVLEQDICPVWVSEFGADLGSLEEMCWLEEFVDYLKELDADWAYWPLNVGDKPDGGGAEPYGMLSEQWRPPPKGSDRRLELLRGIVQPRPWPARWQGA